MPKLRATASMVAEAIAALHHLTLGPDDELEGPDDVRDVMASLSLAMSRMPQLLEQLAVFLEVEYVKGTVAHNHGNDAGERVRVVSEDLHRAGLDAEAMAAALDAAHEACTKLTAAKPGILKKH